MIASDRERLATAYGLLWLFEGDARYAGDRRVFEARKLLLSLLNKQEQAGGILAAGALDIRPASEADVIANLLTRCQEKS